MACSKRDERVTRQREKATPSLLPCLPVLEAKKQPPGASQQMRENKETKVHGCFVVDLIDH
jgi:hypothetical protein